LFRQRDPLTVSTALEIITDRASTGVDGHTSKVLRAAKKILAG
jgi:hypothetical protein